MIDKNKSGIYCIENIVNHKKYIGQSNNVYNRVAKHKSVLNLNKHENDYLQKSWNKYGELNFTFDVIEYCDVDVLDEREIYYIEYYNTMDRDCGYNLISGGQRNKGTYTDEVCKKISNSIRNFYINNPMRKDLQRQNAIKQWSNKEIKAKILGENNGMYGKHHSEESKEKMRQHSIGCKNSRRNTTPVFCIELNQEFNDATDAGKELSLDGSGILKVCQNKRKTCGGYHWKFINNLEK